MSAPAKQIDDPRWARVDEYAARKLLTADAALDAAVASSEAAGLPPISVTPLQGAFLHVLARATKPRAILEIGTLGGYSTIWLARALQPGGSLITLEAEPKHAEVARSNIARAGLSGTVDLRLGRAQETLPKLLAEGRAPFDLIFIDADKPGYANYLDWSLRLARPGT